MGKSSAALPMSRSVILERPVVKNRVLAPRHGRFVAFSRGLGVHAIFTRGGLAAAFKGWEAQAKWLEATLYQYCTRYSRLSAHTHMHVHVHVHVHLHLHVQMHAISLTTMLPVALLAATGVTEGKAADLARTYPNAISAIFSAFGNESWRHNLKSQAAQPATAPPLHRGRFLAPLASLIFDSVLTPPQDGEDLALLEYFFSEQKEGTFLEMGALDGKTFSNSYAFEALGWRGVLVEANPESCVKLFENRPRATCICSAVSINSEPVTFETGKDAAVFAGLETMPEGCEGRRYSMQPASSPRKHTGRPARAVSSSRLTPTLEIGAGKNGKSFHRRPGPGEAPQLTLSIPAEPLGKLLRQVGVRYLDLVSLDVEGAELKV